MPRHGNRARVGTPSQRKWCVAQLWRSHRPWRSGSLPQRTDAPTPAYSSASRLHIHVKQCGRIEGTVSWNVLDLAGAGRPEHVQVVCACGGDDQRALGQFLTAHVGEIVIAMLKPNRLPLPLSPRRCPTTRRSAAWPTCCFLTFAPRHSHVARALCGLSPRPASLHVSVGALSVTYTCH